MVVRKVSRAMPSPSSLIKASIERIRAVSQEKFKKRPCLWQVKAAQKLLEGRDVVCCVRTGAGKTLSFWLPIAMSMEEGEEKISVVVTPLNLLGKQNESQLVEAGIPAIAVSRLNARRETFKVSASHF